MTASKTAEVIVCENCHKVFYSRVGYKLHKEGNCKS